MFSLEKKREIIFYNYKNPKKQIKLKKINKLINKKNTKFETFASLDNNCGDIIHLFFFIEDFIVKKCYFSAQKSCLITIAFSNIIFILIENKNKEEILKIIEESYKMIKGENYSNKKIGDLAIFDDIKKFSNRIECIEFVIRGIKKLIQ